MINFTLPSGYCLKMSLLVPNTNMINIQKNSVDNTSLMVLLKACIYILIVYYISILGKWMIVVNFITKPEVHTS